jgi:predicted transcriptional regulator of viral defense system
MTQGNAVGLPAVLLRRPLRVLTTADAAEAFAHPRPQLARLVAAGVLHRLAGGLYAVVPQEFTGLGWKPGLEAAAGGIGAALFGAEDAVVMGVSAARMHGAVPRALASGVVAVPRQHRPVRLLDRDAHVVFVARDVARLDAEMTDTEVGRLLVTGVEQTALDLARRPGLGGAPDQAREAAIVLWERCDRGVLDDLATQQRLRAAARRLREWTA